VATDASRPFNTTPAQPTAAETDLFKTCNFKTLSVFNHRNELTGFNKGIMSASVQPSSAPTKNFNAQGRATFLL
jgi:hypothetical protein